MKVYKGDNMNRVYGKVRWFDKLGGYGVIRLNDGTSVQFFECNVDGADSHYANLVTNVGLKKGQEVSGVLSGCGLGLVEIKKVVV
jgi:cold shock CspA family protein